MQGLKGRKREKSSTPAARGPTLQQLPLLGTAGSQSPGAFLQPRRDRHRSAAREGSPRALRAPCSWCSWLNASPEFDLPRFWSPLLRKAAFVLKACSVFQTSPASLKKKKKKLKGISHFFLNPLSCPKALEQSHHRSTAAGRAGSMSSPEAGTSPPALPCARKQVTEPSAGYPEPGSEPFICWGCTRRQPVITHVSYKYQQSRALRPLASILW